MKKIFLVISLVVLVVMLSSCKEGSVQKIGSVTFPAYTTQNPDSNTHIETINNTPKFKLNIDNLPEGCEIKTSKGSEILPPGELYSPVYIYRNDKLLGYIGFDTFEPDVSGISQEEYHKTVYSNLRESPTYLWGGYAPVKTTDISETAVVTIRYIEPEDIVKFEGDLTNAPVKESYGILSYNKELKVYVGVAIAQGTITKKTVEKIADSISIVAVY